MPDVRSFTEYYKIAKEAFSTGITDAYTYNKGMDRIDELIKWLSGAMSSTSWKSPPVANVLALPLVGNQPGDVYVVLDELAAYTWNGGGWQYLLALDKTYETYSFSRNGSVSNAYLDLVGGTPSNMVGYPIHSRSTIVFISVAVSLASACAVDIIDLSAPAIPLDSLVLGGTFATKISTAIILGGRQLSAKINGGPARRPVVTVITEQ